MPEKQYSRIFVSENTHDTSALLKYTDDIVFVTTGEENVDELLGKVSSELSSFDPETDAIVPVGRVITTLLVGVVLGAILYDRMVTFGIYKDKDYTFVRTAIEVSKCQ